MRIECPRCGKLDTVIIRIYCPICGREIKLEQCKVVVLTSEWEIVEVSDNKLIAQKREVKPDA